MIWSSRKLRQVSLSPNNNFYAGQSLDAFEKLLWHGWGPLKSKWKVKVNLLMVLWNCSLKYKVLIFSTRLMLLWRNSNKSEEWRRKVITLNWKWHFELFHKQIGWLGSLSLLKYIQVLDFSIGAPYAIKANCLTCSAPISIKWHTGRIWNQFAKNYGIA